MRQNFIYAGLMASSLVAIASTHQTKPSVTSKTGHINKTTVSHKTPQNVLKINGKTISWDKYLATLEQPSIEHIVQGRGNTVGFSALQNLLYETAIIDLAQAKGIKVTPEEIQKELNEMKKKQPHLEEILKSSAISLEQIKNELAIKLYEKKYIVHGITVADKEIQDSYKNSTDYTTPTKYKTRLIFLADESKKEEIDKKLKEGAKFEDVAKEFSSHPNKNEGGLMPPTPKDQFPPVLQTVLEKIKVGEISDWEKLGTSIFKIKLEEITPESKQPLDQKLKNQIREKLLVEKGSKKNKLGEAIINYLSEKKIECFYSKYTPTFNEFLVRVKERAKAQKESKKETNNPKHQNKKETPKQTNNPNTKEEKPQKPIEKTLENTENKDTPQKPAEKTPENTENKDTPQKPAEKTPENTENKDTLQKTAEKTSENTETKNVKAPAEPAKQ